MGVLAYVTASSEKINLFDLETKESIATLEAEDEVTSLTFTQDGGLLATGLRDGSISLWDVETQELVFTDKSHEDDVTALAFSSDGAKLASGGGPFDNKVVLWDIAGVIQKIEEQKKMLPSCWDTPQIEIFHLWLFHLLKIYSPLVRGMARSDFGIPIFQEASR